MIRDIKDQNKGLAEAGKTPKDTSYRTNNALAYSAKVVSTNRQEVAQDRSSNFEIKTTEAKKIQGSYAGLDRGKSTYLQQNGVGYDNRQLQKARYSERIMSTNGSNLNLKNLINNGSYSIMNNYSGFTLKDSSSDRLNSIVNNNMMFK